MTWPLPAKFCAGCVTFDFGTSPLNFDWNSASIFAGNVLPFSQIRTMLPSFSFCSAGMLFRVSSKSAGMSSVTRLIAAGKVPGSPRPSICRSWPFCFACSIHFRTTLSIT